MIIAESALESTFYAQPDYCHPFPCFFWTDLSRFFHRCAGDLGADRAGGPPVDHSSPVHLILGVPLPVGHASLVRSCRRPAKAGLDAQLCDCLQPPVQLDILVAFHLFIPFKWVSKAEVFKLPLIGWNMWLNRYIKLKRGDKAGIAQMFADSERALSQGNSIFIFPRAPGQKPGR
jgi:hypothetical protein